MPEFGARRITISGRVQGVGFRPFVYRLAHQHHITGWVRNVNGAVEIHAEGEPTQLQHFSEALLNEAPPLSVPGPLSSAVCQPEHAAAFAILDSAASSHADIHLPPDGFVCPDCLAELHDPTNRRHRYPFINCTQCGPRYTLITALPYDRPNTSMQVYRLYDMNGTPNDRTDDVYELMYTARDGNIAEDRPGTPGSSDLDDLSRGTAGATDPYLGVVDLAIYQPPVPNEPFKNARRFTDTILFSFSSMGRALRMLWGLHGSMRAL